MDAQGYSSDRVMRYSLGYQIIEMTRRAGGFFAQPEHCQKLLLDVGVIATYDE